MKRYIVSEVDEHGGDWLVGNRRGYKTVEEATKVAEKALKKNPDKTYVVDLYEITGDDRDHIEIIEYVNKETRPD